MNDAELLANYRAAAARFADDMAAIDAGARLSPLLPSERREILAAAGRFRWAQSRIHDELVKRGALPGPRTGGMS